MVWSGQQGWTSQGWYLAYQGIVVCDGEVVVKGELGVEGVVYAPLVGNGSKPSVLADEAGLSSPLAAMLVPSYVKLSSISNAYDS